jgi:hypothetical protein
MQAPANHLVGATESQQIHSTQLSFGQAFSKNPDDEAADTLIEQYRKHDYG